MFSESPRWAKQWEALAIPLGYDSSILDTRGIAEIPEEYQGIIHRYSERSGNAHAPDEQEQDVYVKRKMRGMGFTSHVPVMVKITGPDAEQVMLGAIYRMAREEA